MQEVEERSDGVWRPSPGSVYPALAQLEDEGLIRSQESDGRKLFALTDAGREHVAERDATQPAPWEQMSGEVSDEAFAARKAIREIAYAFAQVMRSGSDAQLAQARKVMETARRDLYRILAEDDSGRRRSGARDVKTDARASIGTTLTAGSAAAVSVRGLTKRYDEVEAVRGIDFEVAAG